MQVEVCKTKYCNFVVWSKDQLLCQRVFYAEEFIKAKLDSLEEFIKICLLPELITIWFTNPELNTNNESNIDQSQTRMMRDPCSGNSTYVSFQLQMILQIWLIYSQIVPQC